jgi:DHA2 family multidrug resistance protein-like MFS transporter
VPKERAGAAAAVSETAYELGMALGIAVLGSIVTGVYRGFTVPPGTPAEAAAHAQDSLAAAVQVAEGLPTDQGDALRTAAQEAFTSGLAFASGVGAVLMLVSALGVWLLLRSAPLPGQAEIGMLDDPGVHGDAGGHGGVDAAGRTELCDRHR